MFNLDDDFEWIFTNNQDVFAQLNGTKIFITGGTGFFGKWLLGALCYANRVHNFNIKITVLTRAPKAFQSIAEPLQLNNLTYCQGDIRNFQCKELDFDFFIHGATSANPAEHRDQFQDTVLTIEEGTRHFLDFVTKTKAKKILYISSGAIYGKQDPNVVNQPDVQYPPLLADGYSSYAIGKRNAEEICRNYCDLTGRHVTIARCFGFVGPFLRLDQNYAVGNFVANCLRAQDIIIQGDGTPCRSGLYAAELVVWLLKVMLHGDSKKAYNIGSDKSISILELAEKVKAVWMEPEFAKYRTHEPRIIVQQAVDPNKLRLRYVPETKLARTELGLKQNISQEEGIRRYFRFHLDGQWVYL